MGISAVVASVGAAIAEVGAGITGVAATGALTGGGIAGVATAIGADAALAGTIGSVVGTAAIGSGVGALSSAVTGGNILTGALTGAVTGGLGGAGAGSALGAALGVGDTVGTGLVGAAVGAGTSAITGGNILTGALTGGASSLGSALLTGGLDMGSSSTGSGDTGTLSSVDGTSVGTSTNVTSDSAASAPSTSTSTGALNAQSAAAAPVNATSPTDTGLGSNPGSNVFSGATTSSSTTPDAGTTTPSAGQTTPNSGDSWFQRNFGGSSTGTSTSPGSGSSGGVLSRLFGSGTSQTSLVNADGSVVTPPVPPQLDSNGNVVMTTDGVDASGNLVTTNPTPTYATQADQTEATLHAAQSQPGYDTSSSGTNIIKGAATEDKKKDSGLGTYGTLALSGLSALSSYFTNKSNAAGNKANASKDVTSTSAANQANYNRTLTSANAPGRSVNAPDVNYYTYGQIPGGVSYFNNNSLSSYGFARGGALSELVPNDHNRHVQGPGTPTSDSIPARLSVGEYILDHADVSAIGGGSNERGARILDRERKKLTRNGGGALSRLAKAA